ncbi:MAG TPA: SPOR domain-containing protein [Azospirillaceae bacterium]|nr:SPOR domain-containing protein [Azospirillaceae bacterium]
MPRPRPLLAALLAGALLGPLALSAPARADMEAVRKAVAAGDYAAARKALLPLAERGDVTAQAALGHILLQGSGGARDVPGALGWFEKAGAQGHVGSLSAAGTVYAYGDGVPADYDKAFRLLKRAAEAGDADAQNNLGVLYHFGLGAAQDQMLALAWVLRAERQGLLQAIRLRQEIEQVATVAQKSEALRLAAAPLPGAAAAPKVAEAPPAPQKVEPQKTAPQQPAPQRPAPDKPVPATPVRETPPPARMAEAPKEQPAPPAPTTPEPAPAATPAATEPPRPTLPKALPPPPGSGAYAVQLAALPSRAEAEKQWRAIAAKHGPALAGLPSELVTVDLGAKGLYTRILVGTYADRAQAAAACARLKGAGLDCLPQKR